MTLLLKETQYSFMFHYLQQRVESIYYVPYTIMETENEAL